MKIRERFTEEEREYICDNYETNTSLELAKKFSCSKSAITRIWMVNGKRGKVVRRYSLGNENYFKIIDTKDKAYFLGFIFGDGCIYDREKGNAQQWLNINIHKKDEYILDRLKRYLETDKPIGKSSDMRILSIVSNKICNDLKRYGVVQRKSDGCSIKNIPKEFEHFFIRGLFDADGCITRTKRNNLPSSYKICFDGNKGIIDYVSNYLTMLGITYSIYDDTSAKYNRTHYVLELHKIQSMIQFYNIIYKDYPDLSLVRKRKQFNEFLNAVLMNARNKKLKDMI